MYSASPPITGHWRAPAGPGETPESGNAGLADPNMKGAVVEAGSGPTGLPEGFGKTEKLPASRADRCTRTMHRVQTRVRLSSQRKFMSSFQEYIVRVRVFSCFVWSIESVEDFFVEGGQPEIRGEL
jgi:hypothetical protein